MAPMTPVLTALHKECAALGTRLFTVTTVDLAAHVVHRTYSSHPVEYPAQGTKPLERDAWFDLCITRAETFVANTPEEFEKVFFDHALITSMGLGSAANLPVVAEDGTVLATVNLLAEERHFTAEKRAAYAAILARHRLALLDFIRSQISHGGPGV